MFGQLGQLGPHIINATPQGLAWARIAPVVKVIDNPDVFKVVRPDALRLFRHAFGQQNLDDPRGTAEAIVRALGGYRHDLLYTTIWVGAHPTPPQVRAVVDLLHAQGIKVCGPGWYSGDYTEAEWRLFRAADWAGLDALALQGYWSPQIGPTIWNALRHRCWYNHVLDGDRLVFLEECGEDTVRDGPNGTMVGKPGWKANGTAPAVYARELTSFGASLRPYEYATPFSLGTNKDFADFDLEEIIPLAIQFPTPFPAPTPAPPTPTPTPAPAPPPGPVRFARGIDVSNNNGVIDWPLVGRCVDFVYIKASEGPAYVDKYFAQNWPAAKAAGLVRGAYHFGRPSQASGAQEARSFLACVGGPGALERGDFLVLDIEDTNVGSTADLLAYTLDFLRTVEGIVGFKPLIYSADWYMRPHNLEAHGELAQYGLVYAAYQTTTPPSPAPWPFLTMWQYSASGTLPGLRGAVDLDLFNGSVDQLRAYGKK